MHWKNETNTEIKTMLQDYQLSYREILPFIGNFSHTTRISEELSKPITEERKKIYLYAIDQAKVRKIKRLTNTRN